jgi:hypothetical protein
MSRVVLIGPNRQENLALQYLAASAQAAGHEPHILTCNARADIAQVTADVTRLQPDVVGLGVQFQHSIDESLLLARSLRDAGFSGHLTCGGHVATFCYAELLRDGPFDSIVRHEGEQTLIDLLDALASGRNPQGIAGLVWRGDGAIGMGPKRPPIRDIDTLPWPHRGQAPYLVAGVPIAFLLSSRGCTDSCSYCSISAFSRDAGGPPFRMRNPEAVAEEVAHLHRDLHIRTFFVQDDLFILGSERATLQRVEALTSALRTRDVTDAAFWVKGRPDSITPAVLQALRTMGVLHVFLGVENAVDERLAYLGRHHRHEDNCRAIRLCREHGIVPSFNLMIFDPDCSLEDVARTLSFARETIDLPWNMCRTEIYSGTPLLQRLQSEGRLAGDYRSYGYRMRDARAELMFRILRVALHERAFAFDSLLNRLISLSFARQLHERFFPGSESRQLSDETFALLRTVHEDTLQILEQAFAMAETPGRLDAVATQREAVAMALAASRRDLDWYARAGQLWEYCHVRGRHLLAAGRTDTLRPRL